MNTHRQSGSAAASTSCRGPFPCWPAEASALNLRRSVVCYASTRSAILATTNMTTHAKTRIVGASVPRKEGVDKLLGRARYVDDIEREGMWHGATVRSSIPRGLIRSIGYDRRIDWTEFTVVTADNIPGQNLIQLIAADQPCLADGKVNHCDEAILLLAHPDKHKLQIGRAH